MGLNKERAGFEPMTTWAIWPYLTVSLLWQYRCFGWKSEVIQPVTVVNLGIAPKFMIQPGKRQRCPVPLKVLQYFLFFCNFFLSDLIYTTTNNLFSEWVQKVPCEIQTRLFLIYSGGLRWLSDHSPLIYKSPRRTCVSISGDLRFLKPK